MIMLDTWFLEMGEMKIACFLCDILLARQDGPLPVVNGGYGVPVNALING